jgi:hypothetical protein
LVVAMTRSASVLLTVLLASAALESAGCYLSHRRAGDGGALDGGPAGDLGRDAGTDAAPACCVNWSFAGRVTVEGFGDQRTVTPRLIEVDRAPAIVVTGPSDPMGPSGAHLVRLSRDLTTQSMPVSVTSGSFTWGQPVSTGERVAVCWGTDAADVVRLYDAVGEPVSATMTLDSSAHSPCIDGAYSGGVFAFVYAHLASDGSHALRVRLVDGATFGVGASVDVPLDTDTQSASLIDTADGFALAAAGPATQLLVFDRTGFPRATLRLGPSRAVQLVRGPDGLKLLRVVEREVSPSRVEDRWILQAFDPLTLAPTAPELDFRGYEPSPSPVFDATADACGVPMLGTSIPSLSRINPYDPIDMSPDLPSLGASSGDTSVLVLGPDAYVAFSAGSPNTQVRIDHFTCRD